MTPKTNLMFFATALFIVNAATPMDIEHKHHNVSIDNLLTQSAITVRVQESKIIDNKLHIGYRDYEIEPKRFANLSLIPQNNTSHFKIILPQCYEDPCIHVTVTKDKEKIFITSNTTK